jgi:hypothetical protein
MPITLSGTNGIITPLDVEIQGATSGSIIIDVPAVAGSNTQTLVATTGTLAPIVSGTAVASTSGTSIDFTGIPSWVKRITVMFNSVSLSGTSSFLIQIGSGSVNSSGYVSTSNGTNQSSATGGVSSTTGFCWRSGSAAFGVSGLMTLTLISSNTWISGHVGKASTTEAQWGGGSSPSLSGSLDRIRITTLNGTDTFDAGTINILYE